MGVMEKIMKQSRMPKGRFGTFWARVMNIGHSNVTRWGLSHISINKDDTILDIGCGGGKTINTLAKIATEGKVYGIDYSEISVAVSTSKNKRLIDDDEYREKVVDNLVTAMYRSYHQSSGERP